MRYQVCCYYHCFFQTGKKFFSSPQCNNVAQHDIYCVSFSKLEMQHSTEIPTAKFTDNYLLDGIISTSNDFASFQ